jgi:hypothetical protein
MNLWCSHIGDHPQEGLACYRDNAQISSKLYSILKRNGVSQPINTQRVQDNFH